MSALTPLIADLGHSLGMPGLQANEHGVVSLRIGANADFFLEPAPNGDAVAYLMAPLAFPSERAYRAALKLCHPRERMPHLATAGLRGEDRLAFFIRLPISKQTLPHLQEALAQLQDMHRRLAMDA